MISQVVRPRGAITLSIVLFTAMAITAPLPVFYLIMAGVLSYAAMLQMTFMGLIDAGLIGAVIAIHLLFYGGVLAAIAWRIGRWLAGYEGGAGWSRLGAVLLLMGLVGSAPMFGYTGHGRYHAVSAYSLIEQVFREFQSLIG